jgi:hypothetical protein
MVSDKPAVIARLAPYLLLAGLGLIFFYPLVLNPTSILYADASDFIVEHVPAKHFLVESWRETGRLPQWCPYNLGGMPFLHDTQVAAFYPPHAILYFVPSWLIGPVLSWLTVAHVILAGWGMHAYARRRGLGAAGSLVAAVGFMFAGKWLMHVLAAGHIVQLGVAWVPLVLLFLEAAMQRKSLLHATLAGAVFSLIVLSAHPQITFYAGLFIALWTLETGRNAGWKSWLVCGGMTALIAIGLSAVELLPTLSAAKLASRWGGTLGHNPLLDTRNILALFGPFVGMMAHENQSGVGVFHFALAGIALYLTPRRARGPTLVFVILAILAFGGGAILRGLPGLSLFRLPARIMELAAFPLAFLAGLSVDALVAGPTWTSSLRRRCIIWIICVGIIGTGLVLLRGYGWLILYRAALYALATMIALAILTAFIVRKGGRPSHWRGKIAVILVLVDLLMLNWGLVRVRSEAEIYAVSSSVQYLVDHRNEHGRILDRDWEPFESASPLGTGAPMAMLLRLEPVRGYEPLDVLRYKEFLQFIEDRQDPLRPGVNLTMPALNNIADINSGLLDLLGVRYVLQPAYQITPTRTSDKVFHDDAPVCYEMSSKQSAGVHRLEPYAVYRLPDALPRAFVVFEAAALPDHTRVLSTMKQTNFRKRVLLEDFTPSKEGSLPDDAGTRSAEIATYEPDRIVINLADGPPGWLVLTDVWYPGWTCIVNGAETPIHRADFLFRAVPVPAGQQEVVFTFSLPRFELGKRISALTLAFVIAVVLASAIWPRLRGGS